MDDYGTELTAIASDLQEVAATCSVRGDGTARFVFAECGKRAIEVSRRAGGGCILDRGPRRAAVECREARSQVVGTPQRRSSWVVRRRRAHE